MRFGQYLIRIVVFCIIALTDGGTGVALGVAVGAIMGFVGAGVHALFKPGQSDDSD